MPRKTNAEKQEPEKTPPEESMDTQLDPEKYMEIEEDLRLVRLEVGQLKRENELLRHINKTRAENHAKKVKNIEAENIRAIKVFEVEHDKALKEISRLQRNHLLKAREDVITAVMYNEKDECIKDIQCKGDCEHVVKEVVHKCTQCSNRYQNKNAMEQHVREVHTGHPNCPFCNVSFISLHVLRKHIDETHPETTATNVLTSASSNAAVHPTETFNPASSEEEVSNSTPQEATEVGGADVQHQEEEQDRAEDDQEETGEKQEDWHQVERHGARFQRPTCGYTRNTKHQLERHIRERHEDSTDGYQELTRDSQITCDLCHKSFITKKELSNYMPSEHKSHKPCDYFKEDKCDLNSDECQYNHIKLRPGQEICFKCGTQFTSKRDMLKHIGEEHGHEICHRYLQNKCTVRRCLFNHNISNATNLVTNSQERVKSVPTQADFHSLPTTGPVVWSQVAAHGPKPPTVHKLSAEARNKIRNMTTTI